MKIKYSSMIPVVIGPETQIQKGLSGKTIIISSFITCINKKYRSDCILQSLFFYSLQNSESSPWRGRVWYLLPDV